MMSFGAMTGSILSFEMAVRPMKFANHDPQLLKY
jgi:hypothetical protein